MAALPVSHKLSILCALQNDRRLLIRISINRFTARVRTVVKTVTSVDRRIDKDVSRI